MSSNGRIQKAMWYLCTIAFYTVIKNNKIMAFTRKLMYLEIIKQNTQSSNITFPLCMQTTFKNINMSVCILVYILPNGKETGEIFMKAGECGNKKGNGAHTVRKLVNSLGERRESAWGERKGESRVGNKWEQGRTLCQEESLKFVC